MLGVAGRIAAKRWTGQLQLLLSLLTMMGALTDWIDPPGGSAAQEVQSISQSGDPTKQLILSAIYAIILLLLMRRLTITKLRAVGLPMTVLFGWCCLSTLWSPIPDGTIRRDIALFGSLLVGTFLALEYESDGLTWGICIAGTAVMLVSIAWGAAFPALGIDPNGDLRGILSNKNGLGQVTAVTALASIHRMIHVRSHKGWCVCLLGLCALVLALSHSATPLVSLSVAMAVLWATAAMRRSDGLFTALLPAAIGLCIASAAVALDQLAAGIADIVGRDATLSGRTHIWTFVLNMIWQRPWVGYGYGIFWLGEQAPGALFWYWSKQYELHAHDGYLQLILDVGFVGLGLYLASLLMLVVRGSRLSGPAHSAGTAWLAMFLGFLLIYNITETQLWEGNSLLTTLYVNAVVVTNLACRRRRATAQSLSLARCLPAADARARS